MWSRYSKSREAQTLSGGQPAGNGPLPLASMTHQLSCVFDLVAWWELSLVGWVFCLVLQLCWSADRRDSRDGMCLQRLDGGCLTQLSATGVEG